MIAAALSVGASAWSTSPLVSAQPTSLSNEVGSTVVARPGVTNEAAQLRCAQQQEHGPVLVAGSYASLELGSADSIATCLPDAPLQNTGRGVWAAGGGSTPAVLLQAKGKGKAGKQQVDSLGPAAAAGKQVPVYYRPGELLIDVADAATALDRVLDQVRRAVHGPARCERRGQSAVLCLVLPTVNVTSVAADLQRTVLDPAHERATPNLVFNGQPLYHGGPGGSPLPAAAVPAANGTAGRRAGEGVRVAVLDTGDAQAPADTRTYVLTPDRLKSTIDGSYYTFTAPAGDQVLDRQAGHGVFVAGVVHQIAPGAQVVHVPVLDSDGVTDLATLVQAIDTLPRVDVVNLSLGGYTSDDQPPAALVDALARLHQRNLDVVVVAAAGGDGSARPFWPAALPDVVAVAGMHQDGTPLAAAVPAWVDVCAVGENVISDYLSGRGSVVLDDAGVRSFAPSASSPDRLGAIFTGSAKWSGSSFAAPQVSGAVAVAVAQLRRVGLLSSVRRVTQQLLQAQPRRGGCPLLRSRVALAHASTSKATVHTVAGFGQQAVEGSLDSVPVAPYVITAGPEGTLYFGEGGGVSRIDLRSKTVRLVAGTNAYAGGAGGVNSRQHVGDGAPAIGSPLYSGALAVTSQGDVFFADDGAHVIRRIDHMSGAITVAAGVEENDVGASGGFSGDGGDARLARFNTPTGVTVDKAGDLFIADALNNRVRRVDAVTHVVNTIAGTGVWGSSGDGGAALAADITPWGLAFDAAGDLLIADGQRIRKINMATGVIGTLVEPTDPVIAGPPVDGLPAVPWAPQDIAVGEHALYVGVAHRGIYRVDLGTGVARLLDSDLRSPTFSGGKLYAISAESYTENPSYDRIVEVDEISGHIMPLTRTGQDRSGAAEGDGGSPAKAYLNEPKEVVLDDHGNYFWSEGSRIRRANVVTGTVETYAGTGELDTSGDGGPAIKAAIGHVASMAMSPTGDLYVVDDYGSSLRRIDHRTGKIDSVLFGVYLSKLAFEDDSTLIATGSSMPTAEGAAPEYDGLIRIDTRTGKMTTLVPPGEDSPALAGVLPNRDIIYTSCHWDQVQSVQVCRIRLLPAGGGAPRILAGGGDRDLAGATGPGAGSLLMDVTALTVSPAGIVYFAERDGLWIRRLDVTSGTVSTVAGSGRPGFGGDGRSALEASFNDPNGLAVSSAGDLYVADTGNQRIRVVTMP